MRWPLLTLLALAGCSLLSPNSTTPPDAFIYRSDVDGIGELIVEGEPSARENLTPAELSAACQLHVDWENDVALRLSMMLLDDDGLYRSAELLSGPYAEVEAAFAVEDLVVSGLSDDNALGQIEHDSGAEARWEAEQYLRDRAESPSTSARDEFVVYLANQTLSDGIVVRRSVDPISTLSGLLSGLDVNMARVDGSSIAIDPAWCKLEQPT